VARTDLTQDKSTANVSAYSTASITPGSNRVILAFVLNVRSGIAPAAQPTAQGNGLTWQAAASVQVTGAPNRRLTCFSATGAAPTPGPLSFDFGGEQQTLCAWSVFVLYRDERARPVRRHSTTRSGSRQRRHGATERDDGLPVRHERKHR
jgi:hypothetical protein